jgi:hypothetical protein
VTHPTAAWEKPSSGSSLVGIPRGPKPSGWPTPLAANGPHSALRHVDQSEAESAGATHVRRLTERRRRAASASIPRRLPLRASGPPWPSGLAATCSYRAHHRHWPRARRGMVTQRSACQRATSRLFKVGAVVSGHRDDGTSEPAASARPSGCQAPASAMGCLGLSGQPRFAPNPDPHCMAAWRAGPAEMGPAAAAYKLDAPVVTLKLTDSHLNAI